MVIAPAVIAPEVLLQQPVKVQAPELFDGTKGKVEVFIVQLRFCFGFQAAQFANETSKILYAASYLWGAAAEWFSRYLKDYLNNVSTSEEMNDKTEIMFTSFDNFKEILVKIYGKPDKYKKAAVGIQRLQQVQLVQKYTSQFYALSAKTE